MPPTTTTRSRTLGLAAAAIAALLLLLPVGAGAEVPTLLTRTPEDGNPGAGAGRLDFPVGIAADPNLPGYVYVADSGNNRIDVFDPWGTFVKAFGWHVNAADPEEALQECTTASGCQEGTAGEEAGQFDNPEAIATDSAGDVYVGERGNLRVQKFDSEGHFILTFGYKVNKSAEEEARTSEENVCPAPGHLGDVCQAGTAGTEPGQLGERYRDQLAVSPTDGTVLVGDLSHYRIEEFEAAGSFKEEIALPEEIDGMPVSYEALAARPDGDLDILIVKHDEATGKSTKEVSRLSASGPAATFLSPSFALTPGTSSPIAVDTVGSLYASLFTPFDGAHTQLDSVLEYDPSGKCLDCGSEGEGGETGFDRPPDGSVIWGLGTGSACGSPDIYIARFGNGSAGPLKSYLDYYGPSPDAARCPPPKVAPEIASQYAYSVGGQGAELRAQINPEFWSDTTYYVEYGTEPCSQGGCESQPLSPGSQLTSEVTKAKLTTPSIVISGLQPGTTYHYRFVAQSSGSKGQPVRGAGGQVGNDGEEATFTTFMPAALDTSCPNQVFRTSFSAALPDCRAYEMVSPVDKNNGDIEPAFDQTDGGFDVRSALNASSTSGSRMTFSSRTAFGNAESASVNTQYLSTRGSEGWSTEAISPPKQYPVADANFSLRGQYRAFSPDLCSGWFVSNGDPVLTPDAIEHFPNIYRRDNCNGGYEALTTAQPPHPKSTEFTLNVYYFALELQGLSADGLTAAYIAPDNLTKEAPSDPEEHLQLYARGEGQLRFVCMLPSGVAIPGSDGCTAGDPQEAGAGKGLYTNVHNALSADGSRLYWTSYVGAGVPGPGPIYLRLNPTRKQSLVSGGECTEAAKACTVPVSETVTSELSRYYTASADGSKAFFGVAAGPLKGNLYEYDADTSASHLIAGETPGVMGASEDGSLLYFASREAIGGAGTNSAGDAAVAGEPNLYLYEGQPGGGGSYHFIATLNELDLRVSPIAAKPDFRASRVSADGLHAVFTATANPTGYDNADAVSGEASTEVYLYDAGIHQLSCVSCNPSGGRPRGHRQDESQGIHIGVASQIRGWQINLYPGRVMVDDGSRVFFESEDALTLADTNGVGDVYEWERPGAGDCTEQSSSFSFRNEGCISLISSGQSPRASKLLDISPDGSNVFFSTLSSLLPQDIGLVDIYDARVEGGYPPPPKRAAACEGEACQGAPSPPNDPTPASSAFDGAGNVVGKPARGRCAKDKVHRHGRCVSRHAKKYHKRAAKAKGRTGR
jgi:hypothetical protein